MPWPMSTARSRRASSWSRRSVERFIHPPALPLVQAGRVLRHNMRRELVTEEELMSQLRKQGVNELTEVKLAYMEGDGRISLVTYEAGRRGGPMRPPP
jgi:uncharacterized membrane protein YcaP (DUF421 family)